MYLFTMAVLVELVVKSAPHDPRARDPEVRISADQCLSKLPGTGTARFKYVQPDGLSNST